MNKKINLPLSKSLSNRQLMIYAIANWDFNALEISSADDSQLLRSLLNKIQRNEASVKIDETIIDCKNSGTVLRFLLPYLLTKSKDYILTGSDRMQQRPIAPLTNSLQKMGAMLEFDINQGFVPILLQPSVLNLENIEIDVSKSSQFASALLMILPALQHESIIILNGEIASLPYIYMTLELMKVYGVDYVFEDNIIKLSGEYKKQNYSIETDWSSASYFYELLAMKRSGSLFLKGLRMESMQGDKQLAKIFASLGVQSVQDNEGVIITAKGDINYNQNIDFADIPDIAPAVICTCAALGVMGKFTGLQSLNYKESRRMDVLCEQLDKLGYDLRDTGMGEYVLLNSCKPEMRDANFSNIEIQTYNDHRMVMAFAPFAIIGGNLKILDSECVDKSFPEFWKEFDEVIGYSKPP